MRAKFLLSGLLAAALCGPALAQTTPAEKQVIDLASKSIALRSVRGEGNQTGKVAELFRKALIDAGWKAAEIEIVPVDDTAYFIATWKGKNPALGPIVISAHMDVVDAKPEDWKRDPFTPVVENGYLYGRGASDTKFDTVQAMVAVMELRKAGFVPERSIVLAFSGDEETTMITSKAIAEKLKGARLVLNVDGASGALDEESGKPAYWSWQGAEKTYADFALEVTNPGGHSSAPRADNAMMSARRPLARLTSCRLQNPRSFSSSCTPQAISSARPADGARSCPAWWSSNAIPPARAGKRGCDRRPHVRSASPADSRMQTPLARGPGIASPLNPVGSPP